MGLISRLVSQAARELASNPESREKASRVLKEDVQPAAKELWEKKQPEVQKAKRGLMNFAAKVREEYRKGRQGD